jgi:hypothetical protein
MCGKGHRLQRDLTRQAQTCTYGDTGEKPYTLQTVTIHMATHIGEKAYTLLSFRL